MHVCMYMILPPTVQLHCSSSWNIISVILLAQSKAGVYLLSTSESGLQTSICYGTYQFGV